MNEACAHTNVEYRVVDYPDGTKSDDWVCRGCGQEFRPYRGDETVRPEPSKDPNPVRDRTPMEVLEERMEVLEHQTGPDLSADIVHLWHRVEDLQRSVFSAFGDVPPTPSLDGRVRELERRLQELERLHEDPAPPHEPGTLPTRADLAAKVAEYERRLVELRRVRDWYCRARGGFRCV